LRPEFEQLQAQLLVHSPLLTMVEAVTLAQADEICLRGVLSSSATVLAMTTGSTTSTPALATSSTPSSVPTPASGLVTQGGTAAATASPRLTRLSSVGGVPPTGRGARVPQPVLVVLLSSLRSGSLSSEADGLFGASCGPSRSIC
jgi:hypothetical protein